MDQFMPLIDFLGQFLILILFFVIMGIFLGVYYEHHGNVPE